MIGRDGDVLRALNFSGGGFDTVMQLGVTHALIVNRGVAPDAVVGISAGTIQAVALAEVMRSGPRPEELDDTPTDEDRQRFLDDYAEVLGKRVARFRELVDGCHRAPEEIVDSLLPDAYQIDSFAPLAPLDLPTFFDEERRERRDWLRRRSGLVRFYNALLALHIPVGTLARLIRRGLGLQAAGSLGRRGLRGAVLRFGARCMEVLKAWIVIGDNLPRLVHIVGMITMPLLGPAFRLSRHGARNADGAPSRAPRGSKFEPKHAGSIIFRFGITSTVGNCARLAFSYLFLLNVWTGATIVVVLLPVWIAWSAYSADYGYWGVPALLIYIVLAVPFTAGGRAVDRQLRLSALKDYLRGALVLGYSTAKWLLVLMLTTAVPIAAFVLLERPLESLGTLGDPIAQADFDELRRFALLGMLAALAVAAVAVLSSFAVAQIVRRSQRSAATPRLEAVRRWLSAGIVLSIGTVAMLLTVRIFAGVLVLGVPIDGLALDEPFDDVQRLVGFAPAIVTVTIAGAILLALGTVVLIVALFALRRDDGVGFGKWYSRRFLAYYDLASSLGHPYGLKRFLVQLFDHDYYGLSSVIDAANEATKGLDAPAEHRRAAAGAAPPERRTLAEFSRPRRGLPNIAVGVATANLESRRLEVMPPEVGIVDALLAATALIPIYPPQQIGNAHYIDASNIGDVPTSALLALLRSRKLAKLRSLHIYAVDPLPISKGHLSPPIDEHGKEKDAPYLNLIDTATRALQLQRFRDSHVERRLTRVFTDVFPPESAPIAVKHKGRDKLYFRAYIAPIELEKTLSLNKKILLSTKQARRGHLAETIAMGCRASLQVMLAHTLRQEATGRDPKEPFIPCADAVAAHRSKTPDAKLRLPGSGDDAPGLKEICKHCCIRNEQGEILVNPVTGVEAQKCLRLPGTTHSEVKVLYDWPHELAKPSERLARSDVLTEHQPPPSEIARTNPKADERMSLWGRACLFGGGVFRGVFQVGVLNALALAQFRPTLLAGASVGSITAASVRTALGERDPNAQSAIIVNLALTNLAVDRLVLTDRFADFVRNWTIRAAETRFSIKQADSVFRKYDEPSSLGIQKDLRVVVAGLERLFYVDPYRLNRIVAAVRERDYRTAGGLLSDSVQQWLDRMGVGREVLGAEPLRRIIDDFVLRARPSSNGLSAPLNRGFAEPRMLVTTTNLTRGALHILGTCRPVRRNEQNPSLVEALLASSAFPGVFRPRQSWDLMPGDASDDEYVDGGLMDNLPLEPVLRELRELSGLDGNPIELRPDNVPHLIVAASLETEPTRYSGGNLGEIGEMVHYWPEVSGRATELKYNRKLDLYVDAVKHIQSLFEAAGGASCRPPLKSMILPVKPLWLCSTFGFHPMLGFRRSSQAKSIAHGCASTLVALNQSHPGHRASRAGGARDDDEWKLNDDLVPNFEDIHAARADLERRSASARRKDIEAGRCWLQKEKPCPFSRRALTTRAGLGQAGRRETRVDLSDDSIHWVSEIHRQCWRPIVHTSEALSGDGMMARVTRFLRSNDRTHAPGGGEAANE